MFENALTYSTKQRGDERQMLLHVGGWDGREAREAALHPIRYRHFPFNHLTATHGFTRNALNPLNLQNYALLKSQQGIQLSLEDIKD